MKINMNENKLLLKYEREININEIRLFGNKFYERYKDKLKIIIDDKESELIETYEMDNDSKIKELEIELLGINNVIDTNEMFKNCFDLISIIN